MAVTGVFTADFSSFDKAVQTSTKNLEGLESGAEKTNSSLRLMTQTQEQMLDKIGASGGKIQALGTTAAETGGQVNTLTSSYKQFDGMLQAAGINIGPQVQGLEDIANAAGKTTTELGLLGTAGLAVGAALTGWKIGQWIDEMTGASSIVEQLATSLMGVAPLMTKAAGEQVIINKALEMGAKHGLDYTESLKFIAAQNTKNADATINWREKLADSYRELRNLTDAQKAEIAIAQEAGATTEQLTNKYGIHKTTLDLLKQETDRASDAQAKLTAEHAKAAAEAEKLDAAYAKLMSDTKNLNQQAIMDADAAKLKVETEQKRWEVTAKVRDAILDSAKASNAGAVAAEALTAEQAALDAENQKLIASFSDMGAAQTEAGAAAVSAGTQTVAAYQGVQQQVELTSDGVRGWLALMAATNRANAILKENSLFTTSSQLERIAAGNTGGSFSGFNAPSFASGVENFGGGLAKVHGGEVLANLPAGTSVFPKGGLGASISNVFNLVDSESNLARRVADLIMRQVRAGTQLGTA